MLILRQMLRALPGRAAGRPAPGRLHCQDCALRFRPGAGAAPCPIGLPHHTDPRRGPDDAAVADQAADPAVVAAPRGVHVEADVDAGDGGGVAAAAAESDAVTILRTEFHRGPDGRSVARLVGEVDLVTACELHFRLQDRLAEDAALVLDVTELAFIDALGIKILLDAAERSGRYGGRLPLVGARPQLLNLLSILRIGDRLPVFDSAQEAAQACDGGRPAGVEAVNGLLLLSKSPGSPEPQPK